MATYYMKKADLKAALIGLRLKEQKIKQLIRTVNAELKLDVKPTKVAVDQPEVEVEQPKRVVSIESRKKMRLAMKRSWKRRKAMKA